MFQEFTLAELAEQVGMLPRTIRSYIEQGLLRGPETGGRGARYTRYHLDRLRAIHVLKDLHGVGLADVRSRLLSMTPDQVAELASGVGAPELGRGLIRSSSSALEYLQGIKVGTQAKLSSVESPQRGPTPVDVMLNRLEDLAMGQKVPRKARGEAWFQITVTPDVEIRVRGRQTQEQLARWERIADHIRHILLGGVEEK